MSLGNGRQQLRLMRAKRLLAEHANSHHFRAAAHLPEQHRDSSHFAWWLRSQPLLDAAGRGYSVKMHTLVVDEQRVPSAPFA